MSTKGIFTALSGAMAQDARLETIANNIANVNTPSYKRDQQIFREYLTSYEKMPDVIQVPKIPASVESFYDMQGGDKSYVDKDGTHTDHSQGSLKATGNPLDMAIEGEGFFEILTPAGVRYTRNGAFKINADGRLVTGQGHSVLIEGNPGQPPEARVITLPTNEIHVSPNGELFAAGAAIGRLGLLNFVDKDVLQKEGNSLYSLREGMDSPIGPADQAVVSQGYLEQSNVNIVREMTDMISASRTFESTQRAIQAYDQMNNKLVNDVPKVQG
jgi:flagellar basal-body rod protein FlgG